MRKRSGAGSLSERISFQEPTSGSDGGGGVIEGYTTQFTEPAQMMPKVGGEGVTASRLQGVQPFLCTVRSSARTRQITPAWRAVNERTGVTYNITTAVNIDERNQWIELMLVAGEAG